MSPTLFTLAGLGVLYFLGRLFQSHPQQRPTLTPSRCEHFLDEVDDAVAVDRWAELWNAHYARPARIDPLEALWDLPSREHA